MVTPLNSDTAPDIERRQIDAWRLMSAQQKATLITGATQAARAMSLAGIRHRYPTASPREQFLRLAVLTLGPELATCAYPEINGLDLS